MSARQGGTPLETASLNSADRQNCNLGFSLVKPLATPFWAFFGPFLAVKATSFLTKPGALVTTFTIFTIFQGKRDNWKSFFGGEAPHAPCPLTYVNF